MENINVPFYSKSWVKNNQHIRFPLKTWRFNLELIGKKTSEYKSYYKTNADNSCSISDWSSGINFYFTIQDMVKYCNRAWKKCFFFAFFRNISKTAETILIKKIGRNHGSSVYKKAQIKEHRKNYIFRDNNCFVKMSVSLLVC